MSGRKYNESKWISNLCDNIRSAQYLHSHNPNYISKPPIEIYSTESKGFYNPKESIDRDIVWKSSSKKVQTTRSQDYTFRSLSKKVDQYHKRNDSGNIISHQFVRAQKPQKQSRQHPAVEKRRQMRGGMYGKEEVMSKTTTTVSMRSGEGRPNYMNSKLMRQTLQYQPAPVKEKQSYMPKTFKNK